MCATVDLRRNGACHAREDTRKTSGHVQKSIAQPHDASAFPAESCAAFFTPPDAAVDCAATGATPDLAARRCATLASSSSLSNNPNCSVIHAGHNDTTEFHDST